MKLLRLSLAPGIRNGWRQLPKSILQMSGVERDVPGALSDTCVKGKQSRAFLRHGL